MHLPLRVSAYCTTHIPHTFHTHSTHATHPTTIMQNILNQYTIIIMIDEYKPQGNLMSYKTYVHPTAKRVYGHLANSDTAHKSNVQNMLRILFLEGAGTTWEMAKTRHRKIDAIREQEKVFRRLIVGRYDRGKRSNGIFDIGLIIKEKIKTKPYQKYRLSLHGILYYIDAFEPDQNEIDTMASKYAAVLPRVFGRWKSLKRIMRNDVYNIRLLAKGLYLNNISMASAENPLYELMSYIHIKYRRNYEIMREEDFAEQISYWFYTFPLYQGGTDRLKRIISKDEQTNQWYTEFFRQATEYYERRLDALNNSRHVFQV